MVQRNHREASLTKSLEKTGFWDILGEFLGNFGKNSKISENTLYNMREVHWGLCTASRDSISALGDIVVFVEGIS